MHFRLSVYSRSTRGAVSEREHDRDVHRARGRRGQRADELAHANCTIRRRIWAFGMSLTRFVQSAGRALCTLRGTVAIFVYERRDVNVYISHVCGMAGSRASTVAGWVGDVCVPGVVSGDACVGCTTSTQ